MPRRKEPAAPVAGQNEAALLAELTKLRGENAKLSEENAEMRTVVGAPAIAEIETRSQSAGTVTVACKIDVGLQLRLQEPMDDRVSSGRGNGDEYVIVKRMVFVGPVYHVFGPSMPAMGGRPSGYILPPALEGGYALTHGIPAAFWEKWLEQNKMAPYVQNKMIFALDRASTKAKARELDELKSGLEPISQEHDAQGRMKDRRIPKPITGQIARNPPVSAIASDDERMHSPQRQAAHAE